MPTFSPEEAAMVKGSFDYIGLNHYTTSYIKTADIPATNWSSDIGAIMTKYNSEGHYIGPLAQSSWLNVYPEGVRGVLNWVDKRYNHP